MSVVIALWRSQIPLLQGASAAVVFTFMLKFSQKSINSFDTNSPPLSLNIVFGLPNKLIQYFRIIFIITFVDLLFIITALLNLENSSIKCKYHKFCSNWCKSMASVSLKSFAFGKPTAGLGIGFLYCWHVLQCDTTLSMMLASFVIGIPARFNKFSRFLDDAWPNCLCNLITFCILLLSVSSSSKIKTCSTLSKL